MSEQDPFEPKIKLANDDDKRKDLNIDGLKSRRYLTGSDAYVDKRKKYYWLFFLLVLIGTGYCASKQEQLLYLLKDRLDDFITVAFYDPMEKDLSSISAKIDSLNQFDQYFIEGQCDVIVAQKLAKLQTFNLSYTLKSQIAECFIHFGLIEEARALIEPNIKNISKIAPSHEEAILQLDHLGDLLLLEIYLASKTFQKKYTERFLVGRCESWFMSYSCVAKILAKSLMEPDADLVNVYEQMELKADILGEVQKSYFYLAGAKLYQHQKNYKKSYDAYMKSFLALPDERYSFKLMLLSDWIYNSFVTKNKYSMNQIVKLMSQHPFNKEKRLIRKFRMIKDLAQTKKERSFTRLYLKNQDQHQLFRDQYDTVNLLLASALKWKLNKELLSFLGHMLEYYTSLQASSAVLNKLRLWPVRVLIGQKNYAEALVHLDSFMKENQNEHSDIYEYFKGICLYQKAKSEKDYQEAFRIFSRSYYIKPSWQALYGQIQSLVSAKDVKSIKIYLDEWDRIKDQNQVSKVWFHASKGQYLDLKKEYKEALVEYDAALKKAPRVMSIQKNKLEVLKSLGQKEKVATLQAAISMAEEKVQQIEIFKLSAEMLFNPMGPMTFW